MSRLKRQLTAAQPSLSRRGHDAQQSFPSAIGTGKPEDRRVMNCLSGGSNEGRGAGLIVELYFLQSGDVSRLMVMLMQSVSQSVSAVF